MVWWGIDDGSQKDTERGRSRIEQKEKEIEKERD